ncbi:MAG: TolC family protein [Labilithrix sp.]|nr:TolC family protein [Labilithrix sp.]MBX3221359.1 TolC family protein [Labilithrix sp.]
MRRSLLALAIVCASAAPALAQTTPGAAPPSPGAPPPRAPVPTVPPINSNEPIDVPMTPAPIVTLTPPPQKRTPLSLDEVLTNVETRYPLLLAEMQAVTAAQGEELSAWGSFDPKWKTKATAFPVGYYQYGMVDSFIEQPLYWRGLSVFGGYRLGQGKFPLYYDGYRTNSFGEARAGVVVPLLRGGSIDEERAKLWKAEAGINAAREGLAATKLEFQRGAAYKYWEWIAAAKKLEVAKTLLQRALDRNTAITIRVARGDAPAVDRTDNARAIVQREQQVVSAERILTTARLALSLYLRDEEGNPVIPAAERVPERFPEPTRLDARTVESDVSRALGKRPEIRVYEARRRQYEVERELAENDAWPTLNVLLAGSKQFGDGYPERQPAAVEAGLFLDIPLRTRKADGRARAADARFLSYDLQLRYAKDKITLEVRDAAAGTDAAAARLGLARRELELAQQLEQAERQRFDMGDSTILFVNIREQATFDAATRELDTLLEHHKALALYRAVVGGR